MSISRDSLPLAFLLCIASIALAFRLVHLDTRPMHGDEANQAYKAGVLLETGRYVYDPHDHHGPTLYYLALIPAWLAGHSDFADTTEFTYRAVPAVFGAGLILLLLPLRAGLGVGAAMFSAVLIAISPAFVFYSRYFIQEMLLVFFTCAAIVCGWRYLRRPSLLWALGTGAALSLMHATKETAVLAYVAMAGALILLLLYERGTRGALRLARERPKAPHLAAAIALGLGISVVLYTAFFTHLRGPLDSILTYGSYLQRAGGVGIHDKPWHYYLHLLAFTRRGPGPWWSEGFVLLLACIGVVAAFRAKDTALCDPSLLRFLALYTILLTLLYALIPYKTPWSMLSFFHGMALLAGVGAAACLRAARRPALKAALVLLFAAGCVHLGVQTYESESKYFADPRNPYVYAHTSTAMLQIGQRAEDIARIHPEGNAMLIKIIQPDRDYWPIPWYLRRLERVGYWDEIPENADAAMIVADPGLHERLEASLGDEYVQETRSLRPGVLRTIYIEKGAWEAFLETRK